LLDSEGFGPARRADGQNRRKRAAFNPMTSGPGRHPKAETATTPESIMSHQN